MKFTWEQLLKPANNVAARYPYEDAAAVETPDPYTVIVRLKTPSAPFVAQFMANGVRGSIIPKHALDKYPDLNRASFNVHPIGSGPFVVAKWEPGVMLDLIANPRYWRGPPKPAPTAFTRCRTFGKWATTASFARASRSPTRPKRKACSTS